MRRATKIFVALLWLLALARVLLPGAPRAAGRGAAWPAPLARLPAVLDGEAGLLLPLAPSERALAASPRVSLERRRYGRTEVALLASTGLKELHPPGVCLRAAGLRVVGRSEEPIAGGCLGWLRVRDGERGRDEKHFGYLFFDGQVVTCKLWKRALLAAGQQLAGRPARWITIQVMDADPVLARRRLLALLDMAGSPFPRKGGSR